MSTLQIVPVSFLEYDKYHCDFRSWDLIYFNLLPSSWRSDTVLLSSLCQAASLPDIVWWDLPQVIQKALSEAFILFLILTEGHRTVHDSLYWVERAVDTLHCAEKCKGNWRQMENGLKLKQNWVRLDIRKKFFHVRVVRPWEAMDVPCLKVFKAAEAL